MDASDRPKEESHRKLFYHIQDVHFTPPLPKTQFDLHTQPRQEPIEGSISMQMGIL